MRTAPYSVVRLVPRLRESVAAVSRVSRIVPRGSLMCESPADIAAAGPPSALAGIAPLNRPAQGATDVKQTCSR